MTVTDKQILTDLRSVSKTVPVLTRSAYRALGSFASSTVEEHFGSFSNAVRRAGVKNRVQVAR